MRAARLLSTLAVLAVAVLAGWSASRRYVAQEVARRISQSPASAEVGASTLARMGPVATPAMLDAAVAQDEAVAQPARVALTELVRRWAYARVPPETQANRLTALVDGLMRREDRLTPEGRAWAQRLVFDLLRRPYDLPPTSQTGLFLKCERLVALTERGPKRSDDKIDDPREPAVAAQPPTRRAAEPDAAPPGPFVPVYEPEVLGGGAPLAVTPPDDSAPPIPPWELDGHADAPASRPNSPSHVPESSLMAQRPATPTPGGAGLGWRQPEELPTQRDSAGLGELPPLPDADQSELQPPPAIRALLEGHEPARLKLVEDLTAGRHEHASYWLLRLAQDASPRVRLAALSAFAEASDPSLVGVAWRLALRDKDPRVAEQLAGSLLPKLPDDDEKLQLVEQLLAGHHSNAPTWLMVLASDDNAKVRRAALSALGSSQDQRLTEFAWRLALRDTDPDVARLAGELQKLLR